MMENTMKMTKEGIPYAKCLAYEAAARLQKKNDTVIEVVNLPRIIRLNI